MTPNSIKDTCTAQMSVSSDRHRLPPTHNHLGKLPKQGLSKGSESQEIMPTDVGSRISVPLVLQILSRYSRGSGSCSVGVSAPECPQPHLCVTSITHAP